MAPGTLSTEKIVQGACVFALELLPSRTITLRERQWLGALISASSLPLARHPALLTQPTALQALNSPQQSTMGAAKRPAAPAGKAAGAPPSPAAPPPPSPHKPHLDFKCLDGVRALASMWIVLLHSYTIWCFLVTPDVRARLIKTNPLVRCGASALPPLLLNLLRALIFCEPSCLPVSLVHCHVLLPPPRC